MDHSSIRTATAFVRAQARHAEAEAGLAHARLAEKRFVNEVEHSDRLRSAISDAEVSGTAAAFRFSLLLSGKQSPHKKEES